MFRPEHGITGDMVIFISGANKGIGLETATQLAAAGHTVIGGSRDLERGRAALEPVGAHAIELDVTSGESIAAARASIEAEFGAVDVLVNNAGICIDPYPPSQLAAQTLRKTLETNVIGVVALTNAFLPLLRASTEQPAIVNVSSELGIESWVADDQPDHPGATIMSYDASKAALNMVTLLYSMEFGDKVRVVAVGPGYTATDLNGGGPGAGDVQTAGGRVVRVILENADGTGVFVGKDGVVSW